MSQIAGQKGRTLAHVRIGGAEEAGRMLNSNRKGRAGTAAQALNPTFNGRVPDAAVPFNVSIVGSAWPTSQYFSGAGVRAFLALGTWPPGLSVGASNGNITGNPITPGAYPHLRVGMTVAGNVHQARSNEFTITVTP